MRNRRAVVRSCRSRSLTVSRTPPHVGTSRSNHHGRTVVNPRSGSVDSALLFGRATDSDDPEAIVDPDALTDPRLRDEVGDIELVAPENRINGPGTTVITATFTLLNPNGRRFPDGTRGLFHARTTWTRPLPGPNTIAISFRAPRPRLAWRSTCETVRSLSTGICGHARDLIEWRTGARFPRNRNRASRAAPWCGHMPDDPAFSLPSGMQDGMEVLDRLATAVSSGARRTAAIAHRPVARALPGRTWTRSGARPEPPRKRADGVSVSSCRKLNGLVRTGTRKPVPASWSRIREFAAAYRQRRAAMTSRPLSAAGSGVRQHG